jgi:hypothetical protein
MQRAHGGARAGDGQESECSGRMDARELPPLNEET